MHERDSIYANLEATDDDYRRAAELEGKVAEYDGYTAEARAGELLLGGGILGGGYHFLAKHAETSAEEV